jgi:hypothetical protein
LAEFCEMLAGTFLFSREGGSPDWIPAFAGKHAAFALGELQAWGHSAGQLASSCIRALVQFGRCGMCCDVLSEGSVMSGSTTMTIRVTSALKARLGRLAQDT